MLALSVFAVDYSAMTTEELAKLRGKMQNAKVEERNAFQNEWQKRIQTMTQEDRQKYLWQAWNYRTGEYDAAKRQYGRW